MKKTFVVCVVWVLSACASGPVTPYQPKSGHADSVCQREFYCNTYTLESHRAAE